MGIAAAIPVTWWLVTAATGDVELGLRSEGRTSGITTPGGESLGRAALSDSRAALSVVPRAAAMLDATGLRLTAAYTPRIWTVDVGQRTSPLVDHLVEARLVSRGDRLTLEAHASAMRGWTDPLADARLAALMGTQLPSTDPLAFEGLRADGHAEWALEPRTLLGMTGEWNITQGADAASRALLPPQRTAAAGAVVTHLATPLDTVILSATGRRTVTATAAAGDITEDLYTALATWRRIFSPQVTGWGGAGVALEATLGASPAGAAGFAWTGERHRATLEARLEPIVDRFSGQVNEAITGAAALGWTASARTTLTATVNGSSWTDGQTSVVGVTFRATWRLRPTLALEAGLLAQRQNDHRPGALSFLEAGSFVALAYESGPIVHPGAVAAEEEREREKKEKDKP